jgi:signal transduction histidine kinase
MDFADLAAFTIHDAKNRLALVATRAEASGDAETLRGILESSASLTRLLTYYKAEKNSLGAEVDARVPADLVNELLQDISKQTMLTVSADLSAAPTLWFYDENLVRMVLLNALYNALRFAQKNIVISAVDRNGWLEFSVADDGAGFPTEQLGAIDNMQPVSRDGTGLGLYLAQRVAALHSNAGQTGRIELNNKGGAVFRLLLPQ